MKKNTSILAVLFILLLTGCTQLNKIPDTNDPVVPIAPRSIERLRPFSEDILDCYDNRKELEDDLDSLLVSTIKEVMASETFPFLYRNWLGIDDGMMLETATVDSSTGDDGYQTNNQVTGVEEVDMVQSDGTFIFTAAGSELIALNTSGTITGRISPFGTEMVKGIIRRGNTLIAIKQSYNYWHCDLALDSTGSSGENNTAATEIAILSYDDEGSLQLLARQGLKGDFLSARLVDEDLFIATSQNLDLYSLFYYMTSSMPDLFMDSKILAENWIYNEMETVVPQIRNRIITELYGEGESFDEAALRSTVKLFDLAQGAEQEFDFPFGLKSYSSFLNLYSMNINSGFSSLEREGLFSSGSSWSSTFYSDGNYMVIANNGWSHDENSWQELEYLTLYENQNGSLVPRKLGMIEGHDLNQFSLDIHNNYLRVATSESQRWGWNGSEWVVTEDSQNQVSIFDLSQPGVSLERTGYLDGLGKPGETIFAVRFMGDRAYVVTFLNTDPFYTLDLSNPAKPRKAGELEIPGFSSYLHPVGENHILGIGRDNGLKIALYDVSSLSSPLEVSNFILGDSWSQAGWDHHAFRYVPSEELLVIPYSIYEEQNYSRGFRLFDISSTHGISDEGSLIYPNSMNYLFWYSRSMLIGDKLITFMGDRVRAFALESHEMSWEQALP